MILLAICYTLLANQADYDGKTLLLTGQFQISHSMGRLSAEKATIQNLQLRNPTKKGTQIYLEEGVAIDVPEGKTPFSLKAKRAFCELLPQTPFSFFQFQTLHFFDQVEISTSQNLIARGGSASYKLGTLTLFPSLPTTTCHLLRGADQIDAHEIRFDLPHETLICDHPKGKLQQEALQFSANQLIWHREGKFLLEGNVELISTRLQDKESFVLADSVTYQPSDETLIFGSIAPKKVLFWQEGLNLSATEVKVRRDPLNEKEIIEGIGDVHFAFDVEEKNSIEKFLSNYL
ncbi:MAG TPA: hypothetical protein VLE89_02995 [Chlamydiales bacterium]|nr:hypothetical protein [Chlamydiales bacterium]